MSGMLSASDIFESDGDHHVAGDHIKGQSQATAIVRLVTGADAELWHTPAEDSFISILVNGHREHHHLSSRGSREYLHRIFYLETGRAPNASAVQDAIATLSSIAKFDGIEADVFVRVAPGPNNSIYLDLGDPAWNVVEITTTGWRVTTVPAVRFRRPRGVLPLPVPVAGGSILDLRPFLNVASDEDFALAVCWQVQTFRPVGPYPVLVLMGEQGSAKSTFARVMRRIIDPSASDLRSEPRESRDLMVAASNGYIITLDNVSRLSDWLSDAICRLATGGGFSTRQLYSDSDEVIFEAKRPVILNGISQVASRADLLDRAIVLSLPVIHDHRRRYEADFWRAFDEARPWILGALLDAVVTALKNHEKVALPTLPRMADFAIWNVAAEPACPWPAGTFLSAYTGNRQAAVEAGLDGDPVVEVVRTLAPWIGTAAELLAELNQRSPDAITNRKDWFSKPRQVADALRRLAPGLRRTGIEVTFDREAHTRRRTIRLKKIGDDASPASPSFSEPIFRPSGGDDVGDDGRDASPDSLNLSGLQTDGDEGDAVIPTLSDRPFHREKVDL